MPRNPQERAAEQRRRAFVDALIGPAKFNLTEAARLAGYRGKQASLEQSGKRLLRHPGVLEMIHQRAQAAGVESEKVLAVLWGHATGSMADFLTLSGDVLLDLERARDSGKLGLINKFKQTRRSYLEGQGDNAKLITEHTVTIQLYSAQQAADKLCKVLGLYGTEKDGGTLLVDEDKLIDEHLRLGIPRDKWMPGLQRRYAARTKQVSSEEVK